MNRKIIILLIISLTVLAGCSESFLENPPLTTITDETFPVNANDAYLVTNAAYSNLRNWWITGGCLYPGLVPDAFPVHPAYQHCH